MRWILQEHSDGQQAAGRKRAREGLTAILVPQIESCALVGPARDVAHDEGSIKGSLRVAEQGGMGKEAAWTAGAATDFMHGGKSVVTV